MLLRNRGQKYSFRLIVTYKPNQIMASVQFVQFRKTVLDSFHISKRHFCRHTPSYAGVVDWVNGCLDIKTRHKIEKYWQTEVTKYQFNINDPQSKMYILAMFPYPSGSLHMGHVRVYTISDTMARYYRMQGKNVLHPMGWDSFGLPAENAARECCVDPKQWTELNISQMRDQLKELGFCFDWKHEVSTCDPKYYHWTQWIFLKLYHAGLVYKKESFVNWDPVDKTVLADEQVDDNNCSWRSGAQVEKKLLRQWFIRASLFSESLQSGLRTLRKDDWQDIIKVQSNWIGEVNGTTADCKILCSGSGTNNLNLSVWLRRPEQFRYASFIAVSKGSMLDVIQTNPPAETFTTMSDDGSLLDFSVRRLSAKLLHPLTNETLPIYVVDGFLKFDHGAETYVGVPEAFEKDRQFLQIVSSGCVEKRHGKADFKEDDREAVCTELQKLGIGGYPTSSSLRDWLVSRQRYWGTPIPMINCDSCNDALPVPFEDLPITLPNVNPGDVADAQGKSPLFRDKKWLHTTCPKCGGNAIRETDTMDTFVDSSWYYLRYLDPNNTEIPFNTAFAKQLMPVDLYVGGKEHANLHLYYARFVSHFLHSEGLLPQKEPFRRLLPQGMVMGRCYIHPKNGKFLTREEVDLSGPHPIHRDTGDKAVVSWEKMSKSKHNGVSPVNVIQDYGVDTTRLIMLADAVPQSQKNWRPESSGGVYRWQNRIFNLVSKLHNLRATVARNEQVLSSETFSKEEKSIWESRNKCVSTVSFNYAETMQFSVGITSMQGCSKFLLKASPEIIAQSVQFERALASLLILMAPMAPHYSSELWQGIASAPFVLTKDTEEFDWSKPVLEQRWPEVDLDFELDLVVEVNGTQVSMLKVPRSILDNIQRPEAQELALNVEIVRTIIGDKDVQKVFVYVHPGYRGTVNLVVPNVEVPEDKIIAVTGASKKLQQKAKKQRQRV